MASSGYSEIEKLSLRPDNMTVEELLQISLSVLTRNVAPTLPSGSIIFVYAQWLDIHRQNPSILTQHWVNTAQQWVHALRALGCSPHEIILGLDEWKMITGNFPLAGSGSRSLPSSYEIIMWYGNYAVKGYHSEHIGYENTFGDFTRPPPAYYVCNRCGISGTFILVFLRSNHLSVMRHVSQLVLTLEQATICRSVPPTWIPPTIRPPATLISAPSVTNWETTIDLSALTTQT